MSTAPKSALILGATGQAGGYLLKELLGSSHFNRVGEFGRRVTDPATLPETVRTKLEQKTLDFEKLEESGLKDGKWDVVFVTLGTSKKAAGSAEAFERIDREYVLNAVKQARAEGHDQRVVYLSSIGADPKSSFLYAKSKGLTELGVANLGYKDALIFRPAVLTGTNRGEFRLVESVASTVSGVLSHFSSSVEIKVATLAKAMALAGSLGSESLPPSVKANKTEHFTLINNAGALELAKVAETQL